MSTTHTNGTVNGTPREAVADIPKPNQSVADRAAELQVKLLEKQLHVMESLWGNDDFQTFGGSDILEQVLRQSYGHGDGGWVPLNVPSDRRAGADWPFWRNETQLANMRQKSRVLCKTNTYARGMLRNMGSHIAGKGSSYKCVVKDDAPEGMDWTPLADATQRVVDDFNKRNRFNAAADPREGKQVGGTREREAVRRVYRDGEAVIRFFFLDGEENGGNPADRGKTYIRFVEPSNIRNPPGGTETDGWFMGMKHRVHPYEDLEDIQAYYIQYTDKSLGNDEQRRDGDGEIVDAAHVVHIKDPDEDAMVGRGTPAFAFDTFDAFYRAGRLQRAISVGSTIRACTAEMWAFDQQTQAQITGLAQGLGVARNNQVGGTEYMERVRPGMIRRGPASMKPVQPPSGGTSEQLEAAQGDLRQGASAFSAPEYMASADASNANYSNTKEAGTPFVRAGECDQEHFKSCFLVCQWKAVRWAVECGQLPPESLEVIDIQCEMTKIVTRDSLQVAQEDSLLTQAGIKDPQTCSMERSLDPETVATNIAEFHERQPAGAGLGLPGDGGGGPGGGPGGGGGQGFGTRLPAATGGTRESSEVAEVIDRMRVLLREWDENKHKRASDGKFGSGGGGGGGTATKDKGGKGDDHGDGNHDAGSPHLSKLTDATADMGREVEEAASSDKSLGEKIRGVVGQVGSSLKSLALGEFPAWALDTCDLWLFEDLLGKAGSQAGLPGAVMLTKAAAWTAAKVYLSLRGKTKTQESAEGDSDAEPSVLDVAKKLHAVMATIAEACGQAAPDLAEVVHALHEAKGNAA